MDFPINVDVFCSDGQYGKTTAVIVDPATEKVSFIAVSDPNRLYTEYLVPVSEIASVETTKVQLKCSKADLEKLDKFSEAEFLDIPYYGYDTVDGMSDPMSNVYRKENVPEGAVAVVRGLSVEATDGFVGTVDELVVDSQTGQVTHLVLRTGHIWGSAQVSIPVSQIKSVDSLAVYLDRDKDSIETLPVVQIRRHYSKKELNELDIEILIWVYASTAQAEDALHALRALSKSQKIDIRNAAILVKDVEGKTKAREIADLGPRRGTITGVITGGLLGLLAGPGGVLVGAATGAITGRTAAKKIDLGFSNEYLEKLESEMQLGNSALVTLAENSSVPKITVALEKFGGKLIQQKVTDDVIAAIAG